MFLCKRCFYVKERIRFLLKSIRFVLCKVKKGWFYQEKLDPFFFFFICKRNWKKRLFERGSTFMR